MAKEAKEAKPPAGYHARNIWGLLWLVAIFGMLVYAFKIGMCK